MRSIFTPKNGLYRCGWAEKENQERVLAIWIKKADFENILDQAVFSSFKTEHYRDQNSWKSELQNKEVRLQWDPDHDPYGNKLERRAIQLGLKGDILKRFCTEYAQKIEDITPFVRDQKSKLDQNLLQDLIVPIETPYTPENSALFQKIGLDFI
ncbi:DUF4291 family protein [Flavobacterium sp. MAH-1]|uniref:DUF4291 family protein n=1 Tax=Flavobacterium agri TaxID=2743471 RepID=A0A7Y8Y7C5_9FLAO|nr:DUF4291 family protein [Flavobacterium agri]NUY82506.1 DUF4291 family protein [Flavobacterium agri]NYA72530.1 DUF4291 family protein [Flavobacterium agri]